MLSASGGLSTCDVLTAFVSPAQAAVDAGVASMAAQRGRRGPVRRRGVELRPAATEARGVIPVHARHARPWQGLPSTAAHAGVVLND